MPWKSTCSSLLSSAPADRAELAHVFPRIYERTWDGLCRGMWEWMLYTCVGEGSARKVKAIPRKTRFSYVRKHVHKNIYIFVTVFFLNTQKPIGYSEYRLFFSFICSLPRKEPWDNTVLTENSSPFRAAVFCSILHKEQNSAKQFLPKLFCKCHRSLRFLSRGSNAVPFFCCTLWKEELVLVWASMMRYTTTQHEWGQPLHAHWQQSCNLEKMMDSNCTCYFYCI